MSTTVSVVSVYDFYKNQTHKFQKNQIIKIFEHTNSKKQTSQWIGFTHYFYGEYSKKF